VYRSEIDKVQKEKKDLVANYQACATKLEDLKAHL
jgi:hypothetical protein